MLRFQNLVLMLLVLPITSQGFEQFEVLDIQSGLSQNTVRTSIQDKDGFIWFGTDDGLNRYDGNRITTFRNHPNQQHTISYNQINDLTLDAEGKLWIATGNGLNNWDKSTKFFSRYAHPDAKNLTSLALTRDHKLWLTTTSHGVLAFSPAKQQYVHDDHINHLQPLSKYHLTSIATDNKNRAWFGTKSNGFFIYEIDTNTLLQFNSAGNISTDSGDADVRNISTDERGNIWIATFNYGLFRYQLSDPALKPQRLLPEKGVYQALVDHHDTIWVGTYQNGLFRLNTNSTRATQILHQNGINESLPSNSVFNLMLDHSRQLWLGTDGGAAKLNIDGQRFGHHNINLNHQSTYNQNLVMRALEDKQGPIWLGTFGGGLIQFDPEKNTYKSITGGDDGNMLHGDSIIGLAEADNGLWIGASTGLYFLDRHDNKLTHYGTKDQGGPLEDSNVHAVHVDTNGHLWVGTYQAGVYLKRKNSNQFVNYRHNPSDSNSLSNDSINHFIEPIPGQIWILTESGVNRYNDQTNDFKQFSPANTNQYMVSAWVDNQSNIWLGTTEGIFIIDLAGNPIGKLGITDGLSNNTIVGILADENQSVWISTNNGLNRYNIKTKEVTNYFRKDGLQSNEFNIAYIKLADGRLLFGGVNGFNLFDPKEIKTDDTPALPVITSIEPIGPISNAPDPGLQLQVANQTVQLLPKYYGLDIYFTGLHYKSPDKNKYRYMLEGLDPDWFKAEGAENNVRYTNLDPGTYTFRLEAYNSDNPWNSQTTTLAIEVLPSWWETNWARCGFLLSLFLLGYIVYRWRTKALHAYALKLKAEVKAGIEEKEQFFENASHEFRTPLTMILKVFNRLHFGLTSFEFNRQLDAGIRNAHRLWRYVNQVLDLSAISSGGLDLQPATYPLAKQVQQVANMFLPEIKDRNLELKLELQEDLLLHYDEMAMEDILVNLIGNAVKYSPEGGLVTLSAYIGKRNKALIQIRDTGPGIPIDQQALIFERFQRASNQRGSNGSGLGLSLVYKLVTAMGGNIELDSTPGEGCCFTVTFPLNRKITNNPQPLRDSVEQSYLLPTRMKHTELTTPSSQPIEGVSSEKRPQLLIIDDEPDMLDYLVEVLSEYELLTARNGQVGFELAREQLPDLIVSDVMMPEMDGIELSKHIRNDPCTSHTPIILVTAKGNRDSKIRGLSDGVIDYIMKPFDESELLLKINNLLTVRDIYAQKYRAQAGLIRPNADTPLTEQKFINQLNTILVDNFDNPGFNVQVMAEHLHISVKQLQRKMKSAFKQEPLEYLRGCRLEQSKQRLDNGFSINQAAEECGFNSPSAFSRTFKDAFTISPSEYQKRNKS